MRVDLRVTRYTRKGVTRLAQIRKLSDKEIKVAKPTDKPIKRTDGDGLYVLNPNGSNWRIDNGSRDLP